MVDTVLFDFDMTLIDSSYAIALCTNMLADAKGLRRVERSEVLKVIGLPIEESWRALWGDVVEPDWADFYRTNCRGAEEKHYRLFENTVSTVEILKSRGVRVGVVTNRRFAGLAVASVGLADIFDVVVGLEDGVKPKPDPEPLFRALSAIGADASRAVYVGDTDIDMITAAAAGIPGIGVTTGNFDGDGLIAAGASRTIADLAELPELIKSL